MKYLTLAVVALLAGNTSAVEHKNKKSLSQRAQIEDEITEGKDRWSSELGQIDAKDIPVKTEYTQTADDTDDTSIQTLAKESKAEKIKNEINKRESSEKNQQLFSKINSKLQDKTFIEQAIENSKVVTHDETHQDRKDDEMVHSQDVFKGDQGEYNTDRIGEWQKDKEDTFNQGDHDTNSMSVSQPFEWQSLPNGWQQVGPSNQPQHLTKSDFKEKAMVPSSETGLTIGYLTVDTLEHAQRFTRELFKRGLAASINIKESGFERSYLKFGFPTTEKMRKKLEIHTTNEQAVALIDFVNKMHPTDYDYPVPDIYFLPVNIANPEYIKWVKEQISTGKTNKHFDLKEQK